MNSSQIQRIVRMLCLVLLLSMVLSACQPTQPPTSDPPPVDEGENDPPSNGGTDMPGYTENGRYNPHASRAEGQSNILLREYSVEEGRLLQPNADTSTLPAGLEEYVNTYVTNYDALGVPGAVTTFQQSGGYSEGVRLNTEAVMAYVSVPSQLRSTVSSWESVSDYYSLNIMMPINRDSHDYVTRDEGNFDDIQTNAKGEYITHSTSDTVYYMVPTENWIEYIWEMVEDILSNYDIDSLTFEEPEMWYASGYSEGFRREWEDYYGEDWEPQTASPEAMLKTMRLKVFLFDRALSTIAQRMHALSPETKLYVASHSTASYTAIAITAGLNSYLATGEIDGVVGQTWTNTANVPLAVDGVARNVPYQSAYLGYASYAGAAGSLDLYAITDTMADGDWEEKVARPIYHDTLVAALMQPEVHRFEASVWPSRGFAAVSSDYRTEQLNLFEALNEMSGKAITTSAGTPGIAYLLSDSLSWQSGAASWSLSSKDGYYGVTLPAVSDGIPLRVLSMENVRSADDLAGVSLLLLSWDCQKPLSEDVCDAIAAWILDGGTVLYVGGRDQFALSEAEWWSPHGSPLQALLDRLELDITLTAGTVPAKDALIWNGSGTGAAVTDMRWSSKYAPFIAAFEGEDVSPLIESSSAVYAIEQSVGKGTLIAVGFPSAGYAQQAGGTDAMQALIAYACESTAYEYAPTTLQWTQRGRIVAAHSFADNNVLVGSFIDLFDPTLPIIDYKQLDANANAVLCDISGADLSIPRYLYGGGSLTAPVVETAEQTVFTISGPASTTISTRLACADGTYPQRVHAVGADGKGYSVLSVWDNQTDSLLVQLTGCASGVTVTVQWGDTPVKDTAPVVYEELSIPTNSQNLDVGLIVRNTAQANSGFRYADGTSEIVYRIPLSMFRNATVSMEIKQNYLVQYGTDGKTWETLADYSKTEGYAGTLHGSSNGVLLSIQAASLGGAQELYIRIADCHTADGWGGSISSLNIRYERYEDEEPIDPSIFAEKPDDKPLDGEVADYEPIGVDYESQCRGMKRVEMNIRQGSDDDADILVRDTAKANATCKFTDLSAELIYCIDAADYPNAVVVASVSQNYLIQVSTDGKTWKTVQNFELANGGRQEGGSNATTVGIRAEKYAPDSDKMYLRFANHDTSTGWGTALSRLVIYYD